jgi:hypothetical protein
METASLHGDNISNHSKHRFITTTARQLVPAVTLLAYIREVSVSNLGHDTDHSEVLC